MKKYVYNDYIGSSSSFDCIPFSHQLKKMNPIEKNETSGSAVSPTGSIPVNPFNVGEFASTNPDSNSNSNTYLAFLFSIYYTITDLPDTAVRLVHSIFNANYYYFLLRPTPTKTLMKLGTGQEAALNAYERTLARASSASPSYISMLDKISALELPFSNCVKRQRELREQQYHIDRSEERSSSPIPDDGNWRAFLPYVGRPYGEGGEPENDVPPCEHSECLDNYYVHQCGDVTFNVDNCLRNFSPLEPEIHCSHCFVCVRKPDASDKVSRFGDNVFMPLHYRVMYMDQVPEKHREIVHKQQIQQFELTKRIIDEINAYDSSVQNDLNIQRHKFVQMWWPNFEGLVTDNSSPSDIRLPSLVWDDKNR